MVALNCITRPEKGGWSEQRLPTARYSRLPSSVSADQACSLAVLVVQVTGQPAASPPVPRATLWSWPAPSAA